jgi:hypothetical protein
MTDNLRWCERAADGRGKTLPGWARSAALAENGTVFVPAALAGETQTVLCASYDGVPMAQYKGHAFVPSDWLRKERPDTAELVFLIEKHVRKYFA